ncbi:MAG: hypothetical protein CMI32_05155 [Opitutales bacterium]|nr:hypothetical protein [Opitutales bacterium]
MRFQRFLKAREARRENRKARSNAPSDLPEGPNVHYKVDSRPPKIKRLKAYFFNDLKEANERFKQNLRFRWMRLQRFLRAVRIRLTDLPSAEGFWKYLRHRRRRSLQEQEALDTRKTEAKASLWRKFRRIYLPEWFRRWTTNKKPISGILTCILLAGLGLGLAAYPTYGLLKAHRAEQLLENSKELHQKGEVQEAFRKAHASYMLNPEPLGTFRQLCKTAESVNYHELLSWRQKLADHPKSKPEDRIKLIQTALDLHQAQVAEEAILNLREEEVEPSEYLYLRLLTTLAQGRPAKNIAIRQCREILSHPDAPLEAYRIYWSLCLDSIDPRFSREAIAHMEQTKTKEGSYGLAALRVLLQLPQQDEKQQRLHARMLWEHPLAQRHDLLLSLRAAFFGKPVPETALRAALGKQYDRLDDADLKEVATTLNDLGLHENAVDLLPTRTMASNKELWAEWLRSRIGSDQIQEAKRILDEQLPFSQSERHFLHSLILRKSGEVKEANRELEEALRLATTSDLPLFRKFVLLHEDKATLVALLRRLIKEPEMEHWARALLILTLQRGVDDEPLEKLLGSIQANDYRNDPETANRISRLKVLHGQDLIACRKVAESLVAQYPQVREYRFTLALCYQESSRPVESLRLLEGMLSANPSECPTQRLIGARALLKNGFSNEAKELVVGLEKISLLPVERRILDKVLTHTKNKQKASVLP